MGCEKRTHLRVGASASPSYMKEGELEGPVWGRDPAGLVEGRGRQKLSSGE